jgi:glycosyltransferase involved in cell wall biosynthesis
VSAPIRILWLSKGLGRGGAERLLVSCARQLSGETFDVDVAYVLPWKDALVHELESLGHAVHCLGGRFEGDPRWVWRLRRLAAERHYDIVHTHMPLPAVAARLVLPRSGLRIVHTEHNVWPRYRRLTRWSNAATYGRNDAVIAVSDAVAASIAARYAARVRVVHHGIDASQFESGPDARAEARRILDLDDNAFVVGTVANLTPKKDQRTLLDAFAQLRSRLTGTVLVLVGTGPLEQELRSHARTLGVDRSVRFAGSRGDVPLLLPGFDVFALSSLAEGLPISMLEAMASCVPVVATTVGGIPEVVTDGVEGMLVEPGHPAELAEAFEKLSVDPELRARMGRDGRRKAATMTIASAQREIESVYLQMLGATT